MIEDFLELPVIMFSDSNIPMNGLCVGDTSDGSSSDDCKEDEKRAHDTCKEDISSPSPEKNDDSTISEKRCGSICLGWGEKEADKTGEASKDSFIAERSGKLKADRDKSMKIKMESVQRDDDLKPPNDVRGISRLRTLQQMLKQKDLSITL